jgi:hypothetical protein
MAIHFFSYGDDKYKNSKLRIKQEANNMGFDVISVYGIEDIEQEFLQKTRPFIDSPRGAGYWIWKPYFMKKKFDLMNNGDYLIYADAGCHINLNGRDRLNYYLELLDSHDSGILSFELGPFLERIFTNEKVFEYFNIPKDDIEFRDSGILSATMYYMKKNEKSSNLVEQYYKIAIERPDLFSDIHNNYNRDPKFVDHRHDQSVFSLLRKINGCCVIPDETYSENWSDLMHVPILATRIRN